MEPYHIKHQHQETTNHSNTAFQIATGGTRDTNNQHLHDETKVLSMDTYLKLYATQLKQLNQTQTHSLHDLNAYSNPLNNKNSTQKQKPTIKMSTLTLSSQN